MIATSPPIARVRERQGHEHHRRGVRDGDPRDEQRDVRPGQVPLDEYGEGDRRGTPGNKNGKQRWPPDAECVVDSKPKWNRRDRNHRKRHKSTRESLADRGRADVDLGTRGEHEHGESQGHESGKWLRARIDDPEAGAPQDEACRELADHHRHQPPGAECEERPSQTGKQ
jgi:hypothetical protein